MNWKLPAGVIALVVIIGLGVWWLITHPKAPNVPQTPEQIIQEAKNEPIPASARAIDEFTFVDGNTVYLKSVHGTSTTKVPDADAETFKSIIPFTQFSNQEILDFCKGPGTYSAYTDKKKVYFFQFWKTPTFSKTKIEVVKGPNPDTFVSSGDHLFTDGVQNLHVGYALATTTCELTLTP